MLIYKITNELNNKVYIGQTTKTLQERIANHRNSFVSNVDNHLYNAMHKYGWDKFHFEIVDTSPTTKAELDLLEKHYIELYDSIRNGYNMTQGGESNPMDCPVSRTKHDSIMRSDAVRARISSSMIELYKQRGGPTEAHRKHLSERKKQLYASTKGNEVRAKFRANFSVSPEHRAALTEGRKKGVYCIDATGQLVSQFDKVKDAAIWWLNNGYVVKDCSQLCDKIKESFVQDKYIKGLKWIYVNRDSGYRA